MVCGGCFGIVPSVCAHSRHIYVPIADHYCAVAFIVAYLYTMQNVYIHEEIIKFTFFCAFLFIISNLSIQQSEHSFTFSFRNGVHDIFSYRYVQKIQRENTPHYHIKVTWFSLLFTVVRLLCAVLPCIDIDFRQIYSNFPFLCFIER